MTQSPDEHSFDGVATDALRAIFPQKWHYKSPREIYSGREYGEDWVIEIVENTIVTGAEFSVQNKVNPKIRSRHISVPIRRVTLERLFSLQRPVLLHAYDLKQEVSYWLWLDEWYAKKHKVSWKRHKEIIVTISKDHVLTKNSVAEIRDRVMWEHRKREIEKRVELTNQDNTDFKIDVKIDTHSITTTMNPLHDGAIVNIEPLDESANASIVRAFETGLLTQVIGQISISGLPNLLFEDYGETPKEIVAFVFPLPRSEDKPFTLRIEYLDDHDAVVFKSNFITVQLVQPGTITRVWKGKSQNQPITYVFNQNVPLGKTTLSIVSDAPPQTAKGVHAMYVLLDQISLGKRIRLTGLENDVTHIIDALPIPEPTFKDKVWRRLVKALVTIEEKLGIVIPLPEQINDVVLAGVERTGNMLTKGIHVLNNEEIAVILSGGDELVQEYSFDVAQQLMDAVDEGQKFDLTAPIQDTRINLWGNELKLGESQIEFLNTTLSNRSELESFLSRFQADNETHFVAKFIIDHTQVQHRLLNRSS